MQESKYDIPNVYPDTVLVLKAGPETIALIRQIEVLNDVEGVDRIVVQVSPIGCLVVGAIMTEEQDFEN